MNFHSNVYTPPWFWKIVRFMVFRLLENAFVSQIFNKTFPSFLPSPLRQREITHYPRNHFSENAISPSRNGEGDYVVETPYLHCQSLINCCFFVKHLSIWTFTKLSDKYITKKIYSKIQSTWENNANWDVLPSKYCISKPLDNVNALFLEKWESSSTFYKK